jgi:hypothetical protein
MMIFTNRILFMHTISVSHVLGDSYAAGLSPDQEFKTMVESIFSKEHSDFYFRPTEEVKPVTGKIRIAGLRAPDDAIKRGSVYWICAGRFPDLRKFLAEEMRIPMPAGRITLPCDSYQLAPDNKSFGWQLTEKKYVECVKIIPWVASMLTEQPFLSDSAWWGGAPVSARIDNAYMAPPFRLLRGQVRNLLNQFMLEWTRWTDDIPPSIPNRAFLKYLTEAKRLPDLENDGTERHSQIQSALRRSLFKLAVGLSD